MKIIANKIKQNVTIIFLAAICALVIFYIVKNPNLFQASVLSLEEKAFMNEKHRDAAYKTDNNTLEIFVSEKMKNNLKTFQGTVYFKPNMIQLDTAAYTGQGILKTTQKTKDSIILTISKLHDINTSEEIVGITFSGSAKDLLLGESKGLIKTTRKKLSIGNLGEFVKHSSE